MTSEELNDLLEYIQRNNVSERKSSFFPNRKIIKYVSPQIKFGANESSGLVWYIEFQEFNNKSHSFNIYGYQDIQDIYEWLNGE